MVIPKLAAMIAERGEFDPARDPALMRCRERLRNAVKLGDVGALLESFSPTVRTDLPEEETVVMGEQQSRLLRKITEILLASGNGLGVGPTTPGSSKKGGPACWVEVPYYVKVYSAPEAAARVLSEAIRGTFVLDESFPSKGGWNRVIFQDGIVGYVGRRSVEGPSHYRVGFSHDGKGWKISHLNLGEVPSPTKRQAVG